MRGFLKELTKRVFKACGLEIHRRRPLRTNMSEALGHVIGLGFRPQTVLDVGVGWGTFDLYQAFPDSVYMLIEPLEEFESALKDICRTFNAQYVLAAADDKPGQVVVNVHDFALGSSIFKEAEGPHADGVPREVAAVTIDSICEERKLDGPYVIKVDVQGAELRVLDGASKVLGDTELVILEVHLFQFFLGGPELYDVVDYMKSHGFCVYDVFGQDYRPLDGALSSVDIAFVKEDGRFRRTHSWGTRKQRDEITRRLIGASCNR